MARRYIPHRVVLLERFGAAYYLYLFLSAQGSKRADARALVVDSGRRYLRAGGTTTGLTNAVVHVQDQVHDLLEEWYGEACVRGFGRRGSMAERIIREVERR